MKSLNRNLIIALIIQAILLVIILFSMKDKSREEANTLLIFNPTEINEVTIKSDASSTTLSKQGDSWLQKDFQLLHVPENKVEELLSTLSDISLDYPVATSKEAAKRFNVAEGAAKTTINLKNGKDTKTMYIGSGSGLRKVYARAKGTDKIYSITLTANQISADKNDWIDKSILRTEGDIIYVKTSNLDFSLDNTVWQTASDIPEGKQVNQQAVSDWVQQFNKLEIEKFIEPVKAEKITLQNPVATFNIKTHNNDTSESLDYAFYKNNDKYYVKLFGEPKLFSVLNYRAEEVLKTDIETFIIDADSKSNNQEAIDSIEATDSTEEVSKNSSSEG